MKNIDKKINSSIKVYAFTERGLPDGAVRHQSCGEGTILSF